MHVPSVPELLSTSDGVHAVAQSFQRCARPQLAAKAKKFYTAFGGWLSDEQLPIVYSDRYNVKFFGVEKLHPFDSAKYGRVVEDLAQQRLLNKKQLVSAVEATREQLLDVHTEAYLHSLETSSTKVARVVELAPLAVFPVRLLQRYLLQPMRFHVAGTVLAVGLALERGWSINLGGGMHHAYYEDGGGWCVYSDVTLAVRALRRSTEGAVQRVMLIDLDVHQGNGIERDKLHFNDSDLYILDMYNSHVYPCDSHAKRAIDQKIEVHSGCSTDEYLDQLKAGLQHAFSSGKPDYVLYNAGTDVLQGDPLGRINVTAEGIRERDALVFAAARDAGVPICMLLSGGYAANNYKVVARSIANLMRTFNLGLTQPATSASL